MSERVRLAQYEPLLQLAAGGMATVYVARQIGAAGFERLVVIKRVHPHLLADKEFTDMFRDEARVSSMLHHPNVVPVTDVVEDGGELFLVMDYVESCALSTLMKATAQLQQRLPVPVVSRIAVDMLSGLHAAHDSVDIRGNRLELVHRDVSPQNIVVGTDGTTRLIDFGIAKASLRITETRSGSLKGKYGYMSPEHVRGEAVDRRADLFCAGIVLWEALTSKRLFRGENELEAVRLVNEGEVAPPSSIVPTLPAALDAVVLKALARPVGERFQSATEFLEALEAAVPPAPARDVTSVVKAFCGDRIEERRTTLEATLAGRIEPMRSMSRSWGGPSDPSGTVEASPEAHRRALEARGEEASNPPLASTHGAGTGRRPPRVALWVGAGALLVVLLGVVALLGVGHGERAAAQAGSASTTSTPVSTSAPAPEPVVPAVASETPSAAPAPPPAPPSATVTSPRTTRPRPGPGPRPASPSSGGPSELQQNPYGQ